MAKNADIGNIYRFSIKNRPSGIHQLQTRGLKQPIFCKYGLESWQMLNIYCMWFMKCCKIWLGVTFVIKRGNQSIYRAIQNTFYFYNISKHMPMPAARVFGVWHFISGSEVVFCNDLVILKNIQNRLRQVLKLLDSLSNYWDRTCQISTTQAFF